MDVTLRIPKNRALHTWWTTCTEEERSDALDLGQPGWSRSGASARACEDSGRCVVAVTKAERSPRGLLDAWSWSLSYRRRCRELHGTDKRRDIMVVGDKHVLIAVRDIECLQRNRTLTSSGSAFTPKAAPKRSMQHCLSAIQTAECPRSCHLSHIGRRRLFRC